MNNSKAKECKEILLKYLSKCFKEKGFELRKPSKDHIYYVRKTAVGEDGYYCSVIKPRLNEDRLLISDFYFKRIQKLEQILFKIQKSIGASSPLEKTAYSLTFSQASINNASLPFPDFPTENDLKICAQNIKIFTEEIAEALLHKLDDFKELDKEINVGPYYTAGPDMKYQMHGDWHIRQLIIARLANNPNFDQIIHAHKNNYQKGMTGEYAAVYKQQMVRYDRALVALERKMT